MIKTRTKIKVFKQPYLYLLEDDCNSYMEDLNVKNVQFMFDDRTGHYLAIITYEEII